MTVESPTINLQALRDGAARVRLATLGLFPKDWGAQLCDLGPRVVRGQKVPAVSNASRIEFLSRANIDKLYPQDKA